MATERRCQECRTFYDKNKKQCPSCGAPKYSINVTLYGTRVRENLLSQAEHAKRYS